MFSWVYEKSAETPLHRAAKRPRLQKSFPEETPSDGEGSPEGSDVALEGSESDEEEPEVAESLRFTGGDSPLLVFLVFFLGWGLGMFRGNIQEAVSVTFLQ